MLVSPWSVVFGQCFKTVQICSDKVRREYRYVNNVRRYGDVIEEGVSRQSPSWMVRNSLPGRPSYTTYLRLPVRVTQNLYVTVGHCVRRAKFILHKETRRFRVASDVGS
jgi:hypothetical protein